MTTHPVLIFGVSGATWRVIDPMISSGTLPALAALREGGAWGILRSEKAPGDEHFRPQVAWTTIATGCRPARHGITRFYFTATDRREPTLWDLFESHGLRIGLLGWPITWPPRRAAGFLIPSHLARDAMTWPPELSVVKELDLLRGPRRGSRAIAAARLAGALVRLLRLGVRPGTLLGIARVALRWGLASDEERALALRRHKLDLTADVFDRLRDRFAPDMSAFVTFLVDFASHRYWRYHEPEKFPPADAQTTRRLGDSVRRAYEQVDRVLGRLVRRDPAGSITAVVSEHGMEAEIASRELGEWRYVIRPDRLCVLAGLEGQVLATPIARWISIRPPPGRPLPPSCRDRIAGLTVVETGLPLFQVFEHGPDEVVVKIAIDASVPRYLEGSLEDLTIRAGEREVPFLEVLRRQGRPRSAMHAEEGIFILRGPGIRPGRSADARLVDLAPTLLRAAGLHIPPGLDGSPLDVFGGS